MNSKLINLSFTGDPMQVNLKDDTGKNISMQEFIKFPEEKILHMLGLTCENLSLIPEEHLFWHHVIILVIRAMKHKLDNKRPVKIMQCKYCLIEFESKTKKTLCPKCRYIKDKECKKQWARKNIKRKKVMKILEYEEAVLLMHRLSIKHDVSVLFDCGLEELICNANISIIIDGHGNDPIGEVSYATYEKLYENKIISGNNLQTYKKRRNHDFCKDSSEWIEYMGMKFYRNFVNENT